MDRLTQKELDCLLALREMRLAGQSQSAAPGVCLVLYLPLITPGDESDEDDENEEERLNEMIGADAPNPTTNEELASWVAERRANFPSKAKIEAKRAAVPPMDSLRGSWRPMR
ncbi:hypothetical protein N0V85_006010 [Neurospora sp. IMI 360204]|nr:hypothetical protein N0V85_006010 [Neurospora sp. IMI 360204]